MKAIKDMSNLCLGNFSVKLTVFVEKVSVKHTADFCLIKLLPAVLHFLGS